MVAMAAAATIDAMAAAVAVTMVAMAAATIDAMAAAVAVTMVAMVVAVAATIAAATTVVEAVAVTMVAATIDAMAAAVAATMTTAVTAPIRLKFQSPASNFISPTLEKRNLFFFSSAFYLTFSYYRLHSLLR